MLGAVVTYSLVALHGIPFLPAAVIAILVCGLLGLLIEFVALRPLRRRNAPPISALISTIGLALIFVAIVEQATPGSLFSWLWQDGANSVRFPAGTAPNPPYPPPGPTTGGPNPRLLLTPRGPTHGPAYVIPIRTTGQTR